VSRHRSTDVADWPLCRDQRRNARELQAEHEADRSLQVRYLGLKDIQVSKLTIVAASRGSG